METIRDEDKHKNLGIMCNNDLSLKTEYVHLEEISLVKYMFYKKFDNHDQTRIILNRVHDEMLWIDDALVLIDDDLIHKVIGLRNDSNSNDSQKKELKEQVEKIVVKAKDLESSFVVVKEEKSFDAPDERLKS